MKSYFGDGGSAYAALGKENTDWQKEIYQLGKTIDGNVAVSGRVGKSDIFSAFRVSIGYHNQDGTLKTSNLERETISVNLNPSFFDDHLLVNLNGKLMNMDNRFANQDAIGGAVMDPTHACLRRERPNGYWWWNTARARRPSITATHRPR